MSRYLYKCPQCGAIFEQVRPIGSDPKGITCPNGHKNIERIYSAPPVVFKGSGYYVTDNRKKQAVK